ncbi:Transcriptional regulator RPN4 [Cladobotryum mycophilum]|uniref:Transcriptional regulator RPN4 n=1 Tax=Cladobotryum mycophilum TaxID=491253 RepID=A0ABR0S993_9HYPO
MISLAPTFEHGKQLQQHQHRHFYPSQQYQDQQNISFGYIGEYSFDFTSPAQPPPSDFGAATAFLSGNQDDPMHPDTWGNINQFTPRFGRFSHQRESSLSSLGSTGPASPYTQHLSNPQIAITDSTGDALMEMHTHEMNINPGGSYYQQLPKPLDSYPGYHNLDNTAVTEMAYPVTIPGPAPNHRQRVDRSLLPAPEFASGSNRSHPASVASSIAGDSPATPTVGELDPVDRRRQGRHQSSTSAPGSEDSFIWLAGHHAPKLDRTMTDVYVDELYSPNFTITSSSSPQQANVAAVSNNDVFNQRINAANTQHLSTVRHSPSSTASRDISPFRHGSPLAPSPVHDWINQGNVSFNSAQRMREQNKARQDAQLAQQQQQQKMNSGTPQTISPKDAMLEFNDTEEETQFPLFPQNTPDFGMDHLAGVINGANSFGNGNQINYTQSQLPTGVQVPQRYPFIAQPHVTHDTPMQRDSSRDSNSTRASSQTTPVQRRPVSVGADSGTYTCTYHGCTLRFETPGLLQKHKREGHRQTHNLGGARPHHDLGMTSSLINSQAGPHRCDRINPSTGKPCNTVFSRPYDLTRHEDTIHNARKQKVHCSLCTEDKTFSRADALTRHYRVCHPDVELPGKHRRRGGS